MYADNQSKLIILLNEKQSLPTLLNAASHLAAGAANGLGDRLPMLQYVAASGWNSLIGKYPVIVLAAKNSSQLAKVREAATDANVFNNAFVSTMLGGSAQEQISLTINTPEQELDYIAIALFGDSDELRPITKKFSVFKDRLICQSAEETKRTADSLESR